jgi:threonine dehydrogenase-like Zn-dependent dehydrogenase
MRAIRVEDSAAHLVDAPMPTGEGVKIKVRSASICGSDLHMMRFGLLEGQIVGHEFAGTTPDGTAVAVEPLLGCGGCWACEEGHRSHCEQGIRLMGLAEAGGMADYVLAPAENLVPLPTGLDVSVAALVEPLAVALRGLDRARVSAVDRVLVIGAGPIGLATVAALQGRGIACDIAARHPHQMEAAQNLGADLSPDGGYDVVVDAVGTTDSLSQALSGVKPMGRIGMVGSFWKPVPLDSSFGLKEVELVSASGYQCKAPQRNFEEAARILHSRPAIADELVTHRFPLDAVDEAFAAAADRAGGAIKVVFDVSS